MKLSDLTPKSVNFRTCGLDLTFRPFTIADDMKAHELCGGKSEFIKAMSEHDFEKISLICWYQLNLESQQLVVSQVEATTMNPQTGKMDVVKLTPINKFRNLILGLGGQIELLNNLLKCKGLNIPDLGDEEELKKMSDQLNINLK